jgi:alkylated DNA nucleotide flippase Atl1
MASGCRSRAAISSRMNRECPAPAMAFLRLFLVDDEACRTRFINSLRAVRCANSEDGSSPLIRPRYKKRNEPCCAARCARTSHDDTALRRIILSIPPGEVSTYLQAAAAAGYPLIPSAVARLLRTDPSDQLPWHWGLAARSRFEEQPRWSSERGSNDGSKGRA